jgi:nucleoside-diphosphate-sugar epimerase
MTYRALADPALAFPRGGGVPLPEDAAQPDEAESRFVYMIGHTERVIRQYHADATIFRYPYVYGPHQLVPREWSIVRRLRDGRRTLVLPEGGLTMMMHGYAGNVAEAVLAAVDRPEQAYGQTYNVGDEEQFSLRQVVEIVARHMGVEIELLGVPMAVAGPARAFLPHGRVEHLMADITRARAELGYRDLVPPAQAIARTVDWLLAHPPEPDGHVERTMGDAFDYAAEDRLEAVVRRGFAELAAIDTGPIERHHAYAHPKAPGGADHRGR